MTTKIAFINQKGGVGKTTLVANCGAYWARQGQRVLLIDLDPQAHLTLHLGTSGEREDVNIYRVFRKDLDITEAPVRIPDEKLDIIPSHIDLSAAEWEFGQEVGREMLLRDYLRKLLSHREYDVVLIDCPPSLGFLSLNALAAVEDVVIPVQAEFFALQGMAQLLKVVELIKDRLHPVLKWRAIVPTLVDTRTNLGREVIAELQNHFADLVTKTHLRKRVKVAEAPSHGQSIFEYAENSPEANEFAALAQELEVRLEIPPPRSSEPSTQPEAQERDGSTPVGRLSRSIASSTTSPESNAS